MFNNFISTDAIRPNLCAPHRENGVTVATNGHKLIVIDNKRLKKEYEHVDEYVNWKKVVYDQTKDIKLKYPLIVHKKNIGDILNKVPMYNLYADCDYCEGTGECICSNCDTAHDCGYCDGTGEDRTKPIGKDYEWYSHIKISNNYFEASILKSLFDFMNYDNIESINMITDTETKQAVFETDDVKILLMPVKHDTDDNIVGEIKTNSNSR
jgi:hypothetical protein